MIVILYSITKYELSMLYSCGDTFHEKCREKEKMDKYREEQTGESWFSIPRCNKSLSFYIQNINLLYYTVAEKSITKNYSIDCMVRKKSGQIEGRTNRTEPVLCPKIQIVVVILYAKYELSNFYSCGDIFDENGRRKMDKYAEE